MEELKKSLRKLMLARIAVVTVILLASVFTIDWSVRIPFFVFLALAYSAGIFYYFISKKEKYLPAIAYIQITADIILVSAVVSITQSIYSPFTFLYILCIFAAGILLSFKGTIFMATLASGFYSLIIFLQFKRIFNPPPFTGLEGMDPLDIFFSVYIKVCAFYLVAILSAYLALNQTKKNKEMETNLLRADKLSTLGQLSTSIIHEIKNPLAAITSSAQYLEKEFDLDLYAKKLLQIIAKETKNLNEYINRFLVYSRVEPDKLSTCNLLEILNETLAMVSGPISKKVIITKNIASDLLFKADSNQIKQVFMNILLNSLQAMKDGGEITINANICEEIDKNGIKVKELEVNFTDTGPGIMPEDMSKVFEPFYTTKDTGTGLGLAIVKRIIEAHEGRISVKSHVDKGTSFIINLPLYG